MTQKRSLLISSFKRVGFLLLFCLTLSLTFVGSTLAQSTQGTVVLDGRSLFEVGDTEQFTAQERATWINMQLQSVVESGESPEISIEQRNQLPAIILNKRYLLTVTKADTNLNYTPIQQAEIWAKQIRQEVEQARNERSIEFIWRSWVLIALVLALVLALHWGLGRLWKHWRHYLPQVLTSKNLSDESSSKVLNLFLTISLLLIRGLLWVGFILWSTNLFPWTRQWSYDLTNSLIASLTSPILSVGQKSYSVVDFLILLGLLLGLVLLANLVTNFLRSRILYVTGINRGIQEAIALATKYALLSIGTIVVLQVWGLDLSSLTILASALGIGIGFGFQDIVKNFSSGFVLIFERSVQVGDFVEIGGLKGTVEKIGPRSTEIRTLDQVSIIVPNSRFLATEVINWSHRNPVSRIHLPVGVAYQSDVNLVRQSLLDAAKSYSQVLSVPQPQVFFKGFGDSALEFELLVWIADPSKQPVITSDLYFRIEETLRKQQIEIPFPQRDLNLRSGNLPLGLSPQLEQTLSQFLSNQLSEQKSKNSNHQ